jgi:uncharacterized damage-inducible protein DinB
MLPSHFRTFARYNAWANERLLAAASGLSEVDYRADRGAYFRSVHGTLSHILVGDRIWMRRLTGEGPVPDRLDAILHDDRDELAAARRREDARIIAYVDGLDEAALAAMVPYRNMADEAFEQPVAVILAHLFNHQTHHRGQIHAMLTGLGREAPALDLIHHLREAA